MPRTWALNPANRSLSEFSEGACALQVRVNAWTMNASTTRFPRSEASETCVPSCAGSVKSGAVAPVFRVDVSRAIFVRPFGALAKSSPPRTDDILRLVSVDEVKGRLHVARRDFLNYRTTCPKCGAPIGPRHATRELMDIPPDPPYGALVRCSRCGTLTYVEFEPEVQQAS